MRQLAFFSLVLLFSTPALARPGFYIGLGIGHESVNGQSLSAAEIAPNFSAPVPMTTQMDSGPAAAITLGFNILGYAAIEMGFRGHGNNLGVKNDRQWQAGFGAGVRAFPLWHWQSKLPPALQPLEPSLYMGWGLNYTSYTPIPNGDAVAWSTFSGLHFGAGIEYFVIETFKLGIDWRMMRLPYDTFIYNFEDDITFPIDDPQTTVYNQILFTLSAHIGGEQKQVRYGQENQQDPHQSAAE